MSDAASDALRWLKPGHPEEVCTRLVLVAAVLDALNVDDLRAAAERLSPTMDPQNKGALQRRMLADRLLIAADALHALEVETL